MRSLRLVLTARRHPLDVAKVRMQTSGVKLSMLGTLSKAISAEGQHGLRGPPRADAFRHRARSVSWFISLHPAATNMCEVTSIRLMLADSMTRFGVYDKIKDALVIQNGGRAPSPAQMALAGCVAGGVGGIAGNPADIILVRMIADRVKPADQQLGYRNACVGAARPVIDALRLDGIFKMTKSEGVSSLFRGITPNVSRAVLMSASQLATCVGTCTPLTTAAMTSSKTCSSPTLACKRACPCTSSQAFSPALSRRQSARHSMSSRAGSVGRLTTGLTLAADELVGWVERRTDCDDVVRARRTDVDVQGLGASLDPSRALCVGP